MSTKDIVSIVILLAVVYLVFQLTKTNKMQTELLIAIADKTGAIKKISEEAKEKISKQAKEVEDNDDVDNESGKGKVGAPKSAPKKIHKQFLSLFKDGVPKTTGQIKALYTKNFKELDKTKFNNTLQYMTKMNLLGKDKAEGKQNFWGPVDWFDEDGMMYEDYLEKAIKEA